MVKSVLLCRPTHFRVDYKINPWMKIGSVNQQKAESQWENLVHTYRKLGVHVEIIEQNERFPDMVFAADQGVIFKDMNILLSRFRYAERRGESAYYKDWYESHGYTVTQMPRGLYFEGGGEMQRYRDTVIIGTGFRSSNKAAEYVGKVFNKEAITLTIIDEQYYHLDTCLFVLNNDTIFYYPAAFDLESQKKLTVRVPHLITITKIEAANFAANSVVVDNTVVLQQNNPTISTQIKNLGFTVIPIDMSEFTLAGGSIHCLTGEL